MKSKIKKKTTQNKRKLIIIEPTSTSSSQQSNGTSALWRSRKSITKNQKNKNGTKKKKLLIIESSTTSPFVQVNKEKIDTFLPKELEDRLETDLKISQEVKEMSTSKRNSEPTKPSGRLNEKFIELMEQLADIMLKHGEPFRARAYQKAQETMMAYPGDIVSPNDLKGKPGIGPTIMEKLNEYMETGTLKILEREKTNPVNILAEVYGIGPKKAKELVDNGITSIAELRENQQMLNDIQKVGLHYYEDILKRIPRSEIEDYKAYFENAIPKVANVKMEIVGSYRRGAESSGDIDVIITSSDPQVFIKFVDNLF